MKQRSGLSSQAPAQIVMGKVLSLSEQERVIPMDQAVCGQACGEGGCTGVHVCVHCVHECLCVCTGTREHEGGRHPEEVAALCQADTTYPHSSACLLKQPGCTQSSRGKNKSPRY